MDYHNPVLLDKSIEGLNIIASGNYVDATFGGGGHSRAILNKLDDNGHLFAFDQDADAERNMLNDQRFTFVRSNFRYLENFLNYYEVGCVDGILADLGVSSWQFDKPERGFSYRFDEVLDMRMNVSSSLTARDVINDYSAYQLQMIFSEYGELRNSKTLAEEIVSIRKKKSINRIEDILQVAEPCIRGNRMRYLSQLFQAIRIEVNKEIDALKEMLCSCEKVLSKRGRLVIISYHSIEDRVVKRFMKTGNFRGEVQKDEYGNIENPFKLISKKPIVAETVEINQNPRARSAKLRIAEKK
jgi:16S rRNA (cytosine1402-N4)-methyltransferase